MTEKFKYGLIGSSGRLGLEVKNVFSENGNELVYSYALEGETKKTKPELIIDCSLPDVFNKTISLVKEYGIPLFTKPFGNTLFKEQVKISGSHLYSLHEIIS